MIYADHAATTQLDPDALAAMMPYLTEQFGNASQPYSHARKPKAALKQAREAIARCIGAEPEEIYFTSGGTESDNWALRGVMDTCEHRDLIVTSEIEHHAILRGCARLGRSQHDVDYLPADEAGVVQVEALAPLLADGAKLVTVMCANNELGTIQPIQDLCEIAHAHGALFHTDAVQAVGHIPIDVKALGVDLLSASAHKFNGPKGIGFLYVKNGTQLFPYAYGGAQESGMRAGTENIPGIVGMAVALEKHCTKLQAEMAHLRHLEQVLLGRLDQSGVAYRRNGRPDGIPGNLSLSFPNVGGEMLLHRLDLMGIEVSTGSACDGVNTQISHVLRAIKLPENYARGTIRVSLGYENTTEEAQRIADAIIKVLSKM